MRLDGDVVIVGTCVSKALSPATVSASSVSMPLA